MYCAVLEYDKLNVLKVLKSKSIQSEIIQNIFTHICIHFLHKPEIAGHFQPSLKK